MDLPSKSTDRRQALLLSMLLCVVGLALFHGALENGFTSWDDDHYVTMNPLIRDLSLGGVCRLFTGFYICNYHPLTLLSYMGEYAIVGLEPWLYHLDNILLHIGASVLAFYLARHCLGSNLGAFITATLFLVHPLRVESVAWVSERKDVLCGVFYLGSLLAYVRHLGSATDSSLPGSGRRGYTAALVLFVLALLSKVMAVTLPLILVLLLLFRQGLSRRRLVALWPFAVLSVLFTGLGVLAQESYGAVKGLHGDSVVLHLLTIPKALAFYCGKLLLPLTLSPRYLLDPASGLLDWGVFAGLVLLATGACVVIIGWRHCRPVALGLSIFAITWWPASGIVPSSTIVADRYLYLPAFGLFLALGAFLAQRKVDTGFLPRLAARVGMTLVVIFVGACLYLTPVRVAVWHDGLSLWSDALCENPRNPYAFNHMTLAHLDRGSYAEAVAAAEEARRHGLQGPRYDFNLCLAYRGTGNRKGELQQSKDILRIDPDFVPAWLVVIRQLREDGELDECEKILERLIAIHPDDAGLVSALGDLTADRGSLDTALEYFVRALKLRPNDSEILLGTGVVLAKLGDVDRAVLLAQRTLQMDGRVLPPGAVERLRELELLIE